ncbi:MAG: FHA domain-containing protein [Pseudomonadota bacterium]
MISCGKGHFYNDEAHSGCPFCGVPLDLGATRPLGGSVTPDQGTTKAGKTQSAGSPAGRGGRDVGETRHLWADKMGGIDPVVGWLVCVEGPDRGRDYRIHAERNFIGRAPAMDIAITGDPAISRENHAVISYNPKKHTFRIAPGDSRGMVYLNGDEVLSATPLVPYDLIELGGSKLQFVPFCGERFTWTVEGT